MPGNPQKRARREAKEREKNMQEAAVNVAEAAGETAALPASQPAPAVPLLQGEVLPPGAEAEPTRTALKRAMRQRAQAHAEDAIAVLVANLKSGDAKLAQQAANDLLAWGFGKPATEIEAGEGAAMIVIRKFVGENE